MTIGHVIDLIKDALTPVKSEITSVIEYETGVNLFDGNFDESGYIDSNGEDATGSLYKRTSKSYEIGENSGHLYVIATSGSTTFVFRFYNDEGEYIEGKTFNNKTSDTFDISPNSKKFRVYTDLAYNGTVCVSVTQQTKVIPYIPSGFNIKDGIVSYRKLDDELKGKIDEISGIEDDFDSLVDSTVSPNIFDENFDASGLINSSGNNEANSSYKRTSAYTEIGTNSGYIYILTTKTTSTLRLRFYDSNDGYTGTGACNNKLSEAVSIPLNSTKFRVYTDSTYDGNVCISTTSQSEYVPKGTTKKIGNDWVDFDSLNDDTKDVVSWLNGKTIAFFGDSIIGNFYDGTGICALLASYTKATVHNCAFGGTQISIRNSEVQNVQYWNALSGYSLMDAIAAGSWTAQDTAVQNIQGGIDYFSDRLTAIKAIDWSKVDIIMWEYGTNDFSNGNIPIKDDNNPTSQYSYYGAYCHAIETILGAYPHIRLVPVTPMWRYWQDSQNDHAYLYGADEHEIGGQLLPDFAKCAMEVASKYHLPYIDDYFQLDANKWTRQQYFDVTDSVHPNANGRARIAKHIAHNLLALL